MSGAGVVKILCWWLYGRCCYFVFHRKLGPVKITDLSTIIFIPLFVCFFFRVVEFLELKFTGLQECITEFCEWDLTTNLMRLWKERTSMSWPSMLHSLLLFLLFYLFQRTHNINISYLLNFLYNNYYCCACANAGRKTGSRPSSAGVHFKAKLSLWQPMLKWPMPNQKFTESLNSL